jgi:hypothetical protein
MPLAEICPENTIAFHPYYWCHSVPNSSDQFNYYYWNRIRGDASKHIKTDSRPQPRATGPLDALEPSLRLVVPQDSLILFSAAHLHSTVPNTSGVTRYSIDFRTIHFQDVAQHIGAANIDSHPRGTSLRDFLHVHTDKQLPAEIINECANDEDADGVLVFEPPALAS